MKEKFYITTPIYYPSGKWHIGHCYTTVCCDSVARLKRMQGFDVCYLTGTDEHGQKIEKNALLAGVSPQAYVDAITDDIKRLWGVLGISYDKFIRTTDGYHVKAVQKIFKKLYDSGDIYKAKYQGMYCAPCESFWTESQLNEDKCPDCGREVQPASEECYFFRLSKYSARIRKLLKESDYLRPETRVNEMVTNFIDAGLEDLAVSRTSFKWGVPVEFDEGHIVYVWIDALSNYLTALGYMSDNDADFQKYWPADIHIMAKEIVRFHSVIWPAILMSLGEALPKKIFGHGWILMNGDKMSKSKGNVVDPFVLSEKFSPDAVRYYLLGCLPYGQDAQYTAENLIAKINTDLVNNLGNLVSRSTAMTVQYFGGSAPSAPGLGSITELEADVIKNAEAALAEMTAEIESMRFGKALERIMDLSSRLNKYIDETAPWVLAKSSDGQDKLKTVLYTLLEGIRFLAVLLKPFIPVTSDRIFASLGISANADLQSLESLKAFGAFNGGTAVAKADALFMRIKKDKALDELEKSRAD